MIKNLLFDQYVRGHRNAEELIKQGESKTLEFKSTLRWNLKENRKDDRRVTHAALKTVAAFLNTEGGDLLLGVADDGSVIGIERDGLENDDKFMRHLAQVVRNGLGDRAGTCIDPKMQIVDGKGMCVVSCQRNLEPVFLTWKGSKRRRRGISSRASPDSCWIHVVPRAGTIVPRLPGYLRRGHMRNDLERWREPEALIDTRALQQALGDPDLRIVDCTTWLQPAEPGDDAPYRVVSGRSDYDAGHIPGAVFLDVQGEISDPDTRLRFMAPPAERFADAMGRFGIGDGARVVLYCAGSIMWATRVWWMLRAFGFDGAAVLDGGFEKWKAEGRPVTTAPGACPPATFEARPRPGFFADRDHVLARLDDGGSAMVNALAPEFHLGAGPSRYGRPGRIPGSVNVPASSLLEPGDGTFVPLDEARRAYEEAGVTPDSHVVAYCGGGISATVGLFLLHQLGYPDLTLYDGSMGEWARDPDLPIETGPLSGTS